MSTKTQTPAKEQQKPQVKTASRVIIVHGDKGGVGKSFVAQAIADYLLSKGSNIAIIEADTANPDVDRMFCKTIPCLKANLRSENGWMDVMDFVSNHAGSTFIVNTPAGIGEHMKSDMATFSKYIADFDPSMEMELWWTMNVQHDSVNLFSKAYQEYGQSFARIRVVCNLHFSDGNYEPFFLWQESPLRTRIENANGMTIRFPGLNLRVVKKMYSPENIMPFADAVDAVSGEKIDLTPSERWKLQTWRKDIDTLMSPAFAGESGLVLASASTV